MIYWTYGYAFPAHMPFPPFFTGESVSQVVVEAANPSDCTTCCSRVFSRLRFLVAKFEEYVDCRPFPTPYLLNDSFGGPLRAIYLIATRDKVCHYEVLQANTINWAGHFFSFGGLVMLAIITGLAELGCDGLFNVMFLVEGGDLKAKDRE